MKLINFISLPRMVRDAKTDTKKLVLVVEDNIAESWALARLLRHAGYHSFESRTLNEARAALRTKPDLIVIDMHLPDGNGVEFCKELKATEETARIPVILVSAMWDSEVDPARFMASGAHSFFAKPLVRPELIDTLKDILSK
ncbi:MAG: response regulator [Proteobacteria bacterium]|nr:MAG: response regulator [Pseudomonadota bacterium]